MSCWAARYLYAKRRLVDESTRASCMGMSHGLLYYDVHSAGYAQEYDLGCVGCWGRRGETRFVREIANQPEAVAKLVERLASRHGKLAFCYEARPCGYGFTDRARGSGMNALVVFVIVAAEIGRYWRPLPLRGVALSSASRRASTPGASPVARMPRTRLGVS